jgi:MATE family multidrug resistance protein
MPAVTHGRVFAIAAPTMVANLTTPLLGIVGTAVIGRLGQAHLIVPSPSRRWCST